ncbi:MAG: phosphatidylserine decarboxylase, partial [Planctomycetota bacterium]|nr:phosphatidylserine decarboxylase [Planctomycetota bacterium]
TKREDRIRVVFEGAFCEQPPFDMVRMLGRSSYVVDDDFLIGWFGLLFVGALNVGQMRFCFDSTLGLSPLAPGNRSYGPPHTLSVGEELGRFEFGSTVVLFVPPDLECQLSLGDKCLARATRLFAPK